MYRTFLWAALFNLFTKRRKSITEQIPNGACKLTTLAATATRRHLSEASVYNHADFIKYSRLSLSRSRRDRPKHFEISVLRHIRFAEMRKIPNEQPNFTNEHVI